MKSCVTARRRAWLLICGIMLLATSRARAQFATPVAPTTRSAATRSAIAHGHAAFARENAASSSTAMGAVTGLVIGALAGAAVGAMIESGNEGGAPEIRRRYRGFGYAVFIPVGAAVGAVVGGIIGATRH